MRKVRIALLMLSLGSTILGLRISLNPETTQEEHQKLIEQFHKDTAACDDLQNQKNCVDAVVKARQTLKASVTTNARTCLFHTAVDADVSKRSISMLVKTFLTTQPSTSKLRMYTDHPQNLKMKLKASFSSCNLKEDWQDRIKVKLLAEDFLNVIDDQPEFIKGPQTIAKTDVLRFKFLEKYGGIYVDGDVLFLADLSPLCGSTFAYRWSYTNKYNSAVLGLPRGSPYAKALIEKNGNNDKAYHPYKLPENLAGVKLIRLPSLLFDPIWLSKDGLDKQDRPGKLIEHFKEFDSKPLKSLTFFSDPTRDSFDDAFPGSFAYHMHGGNPGSLLDRSACEYYQDHQDNGTMAVQIEVAINKELNCPLCQTST